VLWKLIADPVMQKDVLAALAAVPHDGTPAAIVAGSQSLSADGRQAAISTLASRPPWTLALLDAIAAGSVPRGDLSAFTVGQLARSNDKQVLEKLQSVWGTVRATPADRQAEFATWRTRLGPEAMKKADLSHGRATFAKTCGACHQLHGEGGKIGPDLTGSNRADLEYLLANLLDPSAIVGRDYQTTTVVTDDGRSIAGVVVQETPTSLTLRTPTEQVTVPLGEIETRVLSTQSLMPENQLSQLAPEAARGSPSPAATACRQAAGAAAGKRWLVRGWPLFSRCNRPAENVIERIPCRCPPPGFGTYSSASRWRRRWSLVPFCAGARAAPPRPQETTVSGRSRSTVRPPSIGGCDGSPPIRGRTGTGNRTTSAW
jgi:putative heme-binding domain-containing protein